MGTIREEVRADDYVPVCVDGNRNYPLKKIQENNESEIMQTVLEEARESYAAEIVVELESETVEQMEQNVARMVTWIEQHQKQNTT